MDQDKTWEWNPADLNIDDIVSGGDILGYCYENALFNEHKIMVPPKGNGRIKEIVEAGNYTVREPVIVVEYEDKKLEYLSATSCQAEKTSTLAKNYPE